MFCAGTRGHTRKTPGKHQGISWGKAGEKHSKRRRFLEITWKLPGSFRVICRKYARLGDFMENTRWHKTVCTVGKITFILVKGQSHIFAVFGTPGKGCRISGKTAPGKCQKCHLQVSPWEFPGGKRKSPSVGSFQGISRREGFPPGNHQAPARSDPKEKVGFPPGNIPEISCWSFVHPGNPQGETLPFAG